MINRRWLLRLALAGGASTLFQWESLAARRAPDLVVTSVQWSDNLGGDWHTGPVLNDSDVWFQATVRNNGTAAVSSLRSINVEFRSNGLLVAWTGDYRSGLAVGQSVVLFAASSPDNNKFWEPSVPGTYTIKATVDPNNRVAETTNSNNSRSVSLTVEGDNVAIFYVAAAADGGSDSNDGSSETDLGGGVGPKLTIPAAVALLTTAGDRVRVRGGSNGLYQPTGAGSHYITMSVASTIIEGWLNGAVPAWNQLPIIDGRLRSSSGAGCIQTTATGCTVQFLEITRWCEANGFVEGAIEPHANSTTIRCCKSHHNKCSGIGAQWNIASALIEKNDCFSNKDPQNSYGNADGIQIGFGTGTGNIVRFNRSWNNSDDGFDFFNFNSHIIIEGNWSWHNGYQENETTAGGNGQGFKMNGDTDNSSGTRLVEENLAFLNRNVGFHDNCDTAVMTYSNNTSFDNTNEAGWTGGGFECAGGQADVMRNNISYANTGASQANVHANVDDTNNTWNGGVTVTDADFLSVSTTGVDGDRGSNGALPFINFMRLASGSDLINAGTTAGGEPFDDLGAFEFGAADVKKPLLGKPA